MSEEGQCNQQGTHTSESRGSVVEVLPGQPAQCVCRLAVLNLVGRLRRVFLRLDGRRQAEVRLSKIRAWSPVLIHEAARGTGTQHS